MKLIFPFLWFLMLKSSGWSQMVVGPQQPESGPGGQEYSHQEVIFQDYANDPDGYWLFEPAAPKPDSAHVVVFMHGYGAINPMIYGQWIRHLVRQGNIVIFPRYQKNLLSPRTHAFAGNASKGIRDALAELEQGDHVRPITSHFSMAGHSYGGAISAYLAANYQEMEIPQPKVLLLSAPGTGPLKGARLDNYQNIPASTKMVIMVHEGDRIVGDALGVRIFETAFNTPERNLIRQYEDNYGKPKIYDGHNHAYALDVAFDAGIRNFSTRRAFASGATNALDYYGYWKLLDALLDCSRSGENCDVALGNTSDQRYLGHWSDGTPIKELEVFAPTEVEVTEELVGKD